MTYRFLSLALGTVATALFGALLFLPDVLLGVFAVDGTASAIFVARRTAMLFVGYAMLGFGLASVTDRTVQRTTAAAYTLTMLGLVILGIYEFGRGFAGTGIFLAVFTELFFTVFFGRLWLTLRQG